MASSFITIPSNALFNTILFFFTGSDDIDLFRGAANTARKGIYTLPNDDGWDIATSGEIVTPLFKE